jgi:ketosteroid isomerase-like protein
MDTERVELIERFYEALSRRDVDALLELCDDDIEIYKAPGVVEMVSDLTPQGRERAAQYLRGWLASWEVYEPVVEHLRESGDVVVALTQVRSRGSGGQFDLDEQMADVFTVRGRRIARMRLYVSRDEALRAAGEDPP